MKKLYYFSCFLALVVNISATQFKGREISDKRLCADPKCSERISEARATITYHSDDSRILSFTTKDSITIYSKSAGTQLDLWGAEIKGKRGYIPKGLIRESRIYVENPTVIVSTDESSEKKRSKKKIPLENEPSPSSPELNNEQEPYTVVDGTTIYMSEDSAMEMTTRPVHPAVTSTPSSPDIDVSQEDASQDSSVEHGAPEINSKDAEPILTEVPALDIIEVKQPKETSSESPHENTSEEAKEIEQVQSTDIKKDVPTEDVVSPGITEKMKEEDENASVLGYLSSSINNWISSGSGEGEDYEEEGEEEDEEASSSGQIIDDMVENSEGDLRTPDLIEDQTAPKILVSQDSEIPGEASPDTHSKAEVDELDAQASLTTKQSGPEVNEVIPESKSFDKDLDSPIKFIQLGDQKDLSQINLLTSTFTKNVGLLEVSPEVINPIDKTIDDMPKETIDSGEKHGENQQPYVSFSEESELSSSTENSVTPPNIYQLMSSHDAPNSLEDATPKVVTDDMSGPNSLEEESTPTPQEIQDISKETSVDSEEIPSNLPENSWTKSSEIVDPYQYHEATTQVPEESKTLDTENPTPSPIFYEPSPSELLNQEESQMTTGNPEKVRLNEDSNISESQSTLSSPVDSSVQGEATIVEITTSSPQLREHSTEETAPVEVEEESGIFASWIYNLLGYSMPDEQDIAVTTPETITSSPTLSPEMQEENKASSWWWSSSDETSQLQPNPACSAEQASQGASCGEVGTLPNPVQEKTVTDQPSPYWQPHEETKEESMDWTAAFTSGTFLYLFVTSITVLLFTLGHYYIEKSKKDGLLVAKINSLQKELLVTSKECEILKDDLDSTKNTLANVESTTTGSTEEVENIKEELEEAQRARAELEEQNATLEKELEAATEAGLELNKMLSEFLSAQRGSEDLTKSVELLQKQLNKQQATISSMNQALSSKTAETDTISAELTVSKEKLTELETEISKVTERMEEMRKEKQQLKEDLEESCVTLANQLQEAATLRETEVDALKKQLKARENHLEEVQDCLRARTSEVEVLQDSFSQVQKLEGDSTEEGIKKLQALLDVGKAQAELRLITSERDVLTERLQCEEDARQLLEDHVKVIREEVEKLRERHDAAEKEKLEAQTRLEVLSSYFKEKETQLQKELGLQEAMFVQKKEDVSVTHTKIKTLEEEIQNYNKPHICEDGLYSRGSTGSIFSSCISCATPAKVRSRQSPPSEKNQQLQNGITAVTDEGSQNEALKQEIVDQERGLKSQISTLEKKAHENWIAARQAERKLDETKQEAGTLRNRLTMIEKGAAVSQNGDDTKPPQRLLDSNGELLPMSPLLHLGDSPSMSPPHLGGAPPPYLMMPPPPPPPGVFMPPPPPPEYMQSPPPPLPLYPDRRPPPLGRMSSPPPHHFSPPPDRYYRPRSPGSDRSPHGYRYGSRSPSPPPYGHPDYAPYPPSARHWEEPRTGFRPLHREKEQKGSTLSSGHSSESLEKSSRHSGKL